MSAPKVSGWVDRLHDQIRSIPYGELPQEAPYSYMDGHDFATASAAHLVSEYLTSLQSAAEGLEEALEVSRIAIDDWLNTYAAELCDETRVHEARERIKEASGTLAYIAAVQTANRAALAAWRNIAEFKEK